MFNIHTHQCPPNTETFFSVVIPTWNNLPFLQNCIRSIRLHSRVNLQIIVVANQANDGTLPWLNEQNDIDYIYSEQNMGICYGLNAARKLIRSPYLIYLNDDMYVLPGWDTALQKAVQEMGHDYFYLSATMIEPSYTGNPCVIVANYGNGLDNFKEDELLATYQQYQRNDWCGATWPPSLIPLSLWDLVGGMSIEFSPGMYSDPDLSKKLYEAGVRYFRGIGDSLVYHFGSRSTRRIRQNTGRKTFLRKWGITSNYFCRHFLQLGQDFKGPLPETTISRNQMWLHRFKRIQNSW